VSMQNGPQFQGDGLVTFHNSEFLNSPRFQAAYNFGMVVGNDRRLDLHIEWRVWVALWAAEQALCAEGDFVECGVHTGILSGAIAVWTNWPTHAARTMWLLDTFDGMPEEQLSAAEKTLGLEGYNQTYRNMDDLASIRKKFEQVPNVKIVPGKVPDTLAQVTSTRIAYLSIDMNMALPEIAAATHFWPMLAPGGVILLDDYNWLPHINQKRAFDAFAKERGVPILGLPTGQGVIVKPHA
jgi:O-methyltransferase